MNTTTAAAQAGVTTATIRTWCRRGIISAAKTAGRWLIDAASLAHRIAIGNRRRARKTAMTINLDATYTVTYPGDHTPTVITPKIRTRDRDGVQQTTIRGLAPLLAHRINTITDEAARLHTLTVLERAAIIIRSEPDQDTETDSYGYTTCHDYGRLSTTYAGTPHLPVEAVLDLAAEIRAAL